jgi:hypothetical protein
MKLGEYLENFQELVRDQPELIDAEVVYSIDDEGNDYGVVNWNPSAGHFDKRAREFISEHHIEDEEMPINAVLIN